jgi:urea transporter
MTLALASVIWQTKVTSVFGRHVRLGRCRARLTTAMSLIGIPTLTFPYVLTMWLFLLPKMDLAPHPHHLPVVNGVLTKK